MRRVVLAFVLLGASFVFGVEYRVVEAFRIADAPACMPAVTRAPNGDILVAFSTVWEPFPWGGILKLTVSKDNGKTWSEPRVLWKPEDRRVTIQVSNGLQTLSNGDVLLPVTYCLVPKHKNAPAKGRWNEIYNMKDPGYRREVRFLRSSDSGATWTIKDPQLEKPWWRFGRLLETKTDGKLDGRLILPGRGWYIESRDFGKTWGSKISLGTPFCQETNIVQAADGSLFSIMRQGGELGPRRYFGTNFSHDGGKTWSKWRWSGVQGKMPDFLVLPKGRILMAVGMEGLTDGSEAWQLPDRHSFATLFISDDNGRSWTRDLAFAQVVPRGGIPACDGPGMCLLDDGRILVVIQGKDRRVKTQAEETGGGGVVIGNIIEPR